MEVEWAMVITHDAVKDWSWEAKEEMLAGLDKLVNDYLIKHGILEEEINA